MMKRLLGETDNGRVYTWKCAADRKKGRVSYGRVVGRANNNANANGGLVYANANNASSNSNTNYGSRLTFKTYGGIKNKMPTDNRFYGTAT